jgi:hypothetical protein
MAQKRVPLSHDSKAVSDLEAISRKVSQSWGVQTPKGRGSTMGLYWS